MGKRPARQIEGDRLKATLLRIRQWAGVLPFQHIMAHSGFPNVRPMPTELDATSFCKLAFTGSHRSPPWPTAMDSNYP